MSLLSNWINYLTSPFSIHFEDPNDPHKKTVFRNGLEEMISSAEDCWKKAQINEDHVKINNQKNFLKRRIIKFLDNNPESLNNSESQEKFQTTFQKVGQLWDQITYKKSNPESINFENFLKELKADYPYSLLQNFEYDSSKAGIKNPSYTIETLDGLIKKGNDCFERAQKNHADLMKVKEQKKIFRRYILKFCRKNPQADFSKSIEKIRSIWDQITSLQKNQDKVKSFQTFVEELKLKFPAIDLTSSSIKTKKIKQKPSQETATGADIGLEAEAAEPSEKKRKHRKSEETKTGEEFGFTVKATPSASSSDTGHTVKKSTRKKRDRPIFDPSPAEREVVPAPTPAKKSTKRKAAPSSNSYVLKGAPLPGNTVQKMIENIRGKTYAATPIYSEKFSSHWRETKHEKLYGSHKAKFDAYRKEVEAGRDPADKSINIVDTKDPIFKNIIVAKTAIKKGTIVGEYTGDVIPGNKTKRADLHVFQIVGEEEGDFVISGRYSCNHTAFFSHKTDCNVEIFYYDDDEGRHVVFQTKKDIEPGDILSFNYSKEYWEGLGVDPIEDYHYEGTI